MLLSRCESVNVISLKDHFSPHSSTKLASVLALLLCNGNLSLFKLSVFLLKLHYFGGHKHQNHKISQHNSCPVLFYNKELHTDRKHRTGTILPPYCRQSFILHATMEVLIPPYTFVFQVK